METKTLEDITIENMLANIFTNTTIKKSRKDIVAYYRQVIWQIIYSASLMVNLKNVSTMF